MKKASIKIISIVMLMVLAFSACSNSKPVSKVEKNEWNTNYKYVFVHGLSGWGSYDFQNKFIKYWGMFGGDLLKYLNEQGYDCYAASVDPKGSAWDRACELYAQLTGTVVDYGVEHSKRCNHERFGEDYTDRALIDNWSSENKINLLGHSFGGATVRVLSTLMADGSEAEQQATDEENISALFTGGKGDWIYSITALAAPHNGTSAYNTDDEEEDITFIQSFMSDMVGKSTKNSGDGRVDSDYANYDLNIDHAIELNELLPTYDNLYYFSIPCSSTLKNDDGTYSPDEERTEVTFIKSAIKMGKCTAKTENGFEINEQWFENDGLVNTISAKAPFNSPSKEYDENNVSKGEWNIMPTYKGDHMSLQGGLFKTNDVNEYYADLLDMINSLSEQQED
ncbi:MAG: hypothetical protein K2F65_02600 [Eubacterium sp.]|nr:hypothetical protein [Eubacterium sp.]